MAFSTSLPSTSTSLESHTRIPDEAVSRVWFCSIATWLLWRVRPRGGAGLAPMH
jgi:hypothetical protein